MPDFDHIDEHIRNEREKRWANRQGPRVGDFVEMKDGTLRRFTHDWGDGLQTTCLQSCGQFYLERDGHMSYSGSLDRRIPTCQLKDTGRVSAGRVWFFHHDECRGHNGVYAFVDCRVYKHEDA